MSDELERQLSDLSRQAPTDVPAELLADVRASAAGLRASRRRTLRNRALVAVLAVVVLTGASLTPPGRAATGWIGRLAGIGEEPSLPQVGSVQGEAVVLESGELPDGTPYEVVAKRTTAESFIEAAADSPAQADEMRENGFGEIPDSLCFQIDWPGVQTQGQGGACTTNVDIDRTAGRPFDGAVVAKPPGARNSDGPGIFIGGIGRADLADVRIVQIDRDGNEIELPSKTLTVDAESLEPVAGENPVSLFFAVLEGSVVEAGNARQAQVSAVAYDEAGERLGSTNAFPPLDCPVDPDTLLPPPPAIPEPPHPTTPQEAAEFQRAAECGAAVVSRSPPRVAMDQGSLERGPVAQPLLEAAKRLGFPLEQATHDQLASVFDEDFSGATADDVIRHRPYTPPDDTSGYSGPSRIYLARRSGSDQLVYVAQRTVNALLYPDGTRETNVDGLPRTFITIVDVASGDVLLERELPYAKRS